MTRTHGFNLQAFADAIEGSRWLRESPDLTWTGAAIDTRSLGAGQVFFALGGTQVDGHGFVAEALEQGAACAVVDRPDAIDPSDAGGVLVVPKVEDAMAQAARAYRRSVLGGAKVLAVTGSNGKTSTCRLLAGACSTRRARAWLPEGSFNNHLGVPMTLLNAPAESKFVVCEVGSSAPGEVAHLANIIRPDACAIVSVGRSHLEGFADTNAVADEKASLSVGVPLGGLVAVCGDMPGLAERVAPGRRLITYGFGAHNDRRVEVLESTDTSVRCSVGGLGELQVPIPGAHSALNAAAAMIVATESGMSVHEAAWGIACATPPPMRLEWKTLGGVRLLVDAYNANPDSTLAALGVIAQTEAARRVAVLGDMLELGAQTPHLHHEVLAAAIENDRLDLIVCIGPAYAQAAHAFPQASTNGRLHVYADPMGDWTARVGDTLRSADAVLLKGSRGMALERLLQVIERTDERMDERAVERAPVTEDRG